jgi:hypothetical protein
MKIAGVDPNTANVTALTRPFCEIVYGRSL